MSTLRDLGIGILESERVPSGLDSDREVDTVWALEINLRQTSEHPARLARP